MTNQTTYERLMTQMARKEMTKPHPELTGEGELMDDQEAFHRITKNLADRCGNAGGEIQRIRIYLEFIGNYHYNAAGTAVAFADKTGDGLAQKAAMVFAKGKDLADALQKNLGITNSQMSAVGNYLKIESLVKRRVKPECVMETMAAIAVWCAFNLREEFNAMAEQEKKYSFVALFGFEGEHEKEERTRADMAGFLAALVKEGYDCLFPNDDDYLN